MTPLTDPPPWAFEPCPGCRQPLSLDTHELTCPCFDHRTRVAVAWICDDCDLIVGMVGLFTTWSEAFSARQAELDGRAARCRTRTHLRTHDMFTDNDAACLSNLARLTIPAERRRIVTTESRRYSPE